MGGYIVWDCPSGTGENGRIGSESVLIVWNHDESEYYHHIVWTRNKERAQGMDQERNGQKEWTNWKR